MQAAPIDTPWRRVVAASFPPPNSPFIETSFEVEVEAVEAYVQSHRQHGQLLGVLHFILAAAARTIAEDVPRMNTYLRRGRVRAREGVDIVMPALIPGSDDLVDVRVSSANELSASAIAASLHSQVKAHRARVRAGTMRRRFALADVPWPLRRVLFKTLAFVSRELGIALPQLEMSPDRFGSLVISEVGRFCSSVEVREAAGLTYSQIAGAPFPVAQNAGLLLIGPTQRRAVVTKGGIEVRRKVMCGLKVDHRLVDGLHMGQFCTGFARRLQEPALLDEQVVR